MLSPQRFGTAVRTSHSSVFFLCLPCWGVCVPPKPIEVTAHMLTCKTQAQLSCLSDVCTQGEEVRLGLAKLVAAVVAHVPAAQLLGDVPDLALVVSR